MIPRLVAVAVRAPLVVLALALALIVGGLLAFRQLDIEAYPNPVPPMVEVIVQPEGWSADEVERYVTVPLEVGLAGMNGLEHTRSQSLFGLSDVKCYFDWGTDYEKARQEVINRIGFVTLPQQLQASLSPWNAIGEVFRYTVEGAGYDLKDRKAQEDWVLERQFKQAKGVIDVTSFGGETKAYHVDVDPYRLKGHGVTLTQLMTAVQSANQNVGGQRLFIGEQSYDVRGIGLFENRHDIENVVVAEQKGTAVRVHDVSDVDVGFAPRLGKVGKDDQADVVEGIVLMRYGGETEPTLTAVHARLKLIEDRHLLPPGMKIVPYYDRGDLVKVTTHTVLENLLLGMGLVTVVLLLFLGHARAALITAINIPLALMVAFCGLVASGTSANLISLGAVDFGIVVDSTVIMMENIFRHLGAHGRGSIRERVLAAAREVATPMTFSTLIIGVAFLPLFTMTGVSGVIFAPMARTYALAIGGAIVLALTLTPVLASKALPESAEDKENWLMRAIHRVYRPALAKVLARPRLSIAAGIVPLVLCVAAFPFLGGEFMPKLEEGNLWIRATLPTSVNLDQSSKYVERMRGIIRGAPEVVTVVSQVGRPDDGTDVSGFGNIEIFAPLKPFDQWPRGVTKEKLTEELSRELSESFPDVVFNFSQMISDNVEEAVSGVKGENSVKVFGPRVADNETIAAQITDVLGGVKGIADLGTFHSLGQPSIHITPNRLECARYGLNTGDVGNEIQAAIGGRAVTQVFEGEKRFDVVIRWKAEYRSSVEAIREINVPTPDGSFVPLGQIAKVEIADGMSVVYREDGQRYTPVKFSVRGRDLAGTIAEAKQRIDAKIHLPYDTHLEWSGEINELKEAQQRLLIIVPLTLLVIALLAYSAVKHWLDTLIVLVNIPVACAGGILALVVTRESFSVSAAMGFISIFGIAIQDAILVVTYFRRLRDVDGLSIEDAAREAAEKRLRPVLMTTLVAALGLLPAAISNGIGAQTQKPLAIVVIGGALMLAVLTRLLQPPILVVLHRWLEAVRARRHTFIVVPPEEAS
ncbi:MAG TPA: CusA/CzcA family heavy metal efflux RND transporter [Polyangiaceae bacterium]|jgi:cobalt-zinc-cadmium resistance protein CzcA